MRGLGLPSLFRDLVGPFVIVFAVLTQLGDLWLLSLAAASVYWLDHRAPLVGRGLDRRRTATVVALLCCAMALLVVLKPLFGFVRPTGFGPPPAADHLPAALHGVYVRIATADGYGFPSGHALGSTIVWGGLAWAVRVGRRRSRAAVAGAIVAVVSLSRLVLAVHYLVDVVAGAAVGLLVLWVALRRLSSPLSVFGLATAVALVGVTLGALDVLAGGISHDLTAVTGLCLGATAAWYRYRDALLGPPSRRGALATVAVGLLLVAPLLAGAALVPASPWLVVALAAVGGALLVAVPLAGERATAAT